jgi:uncharacterized membrane protein
MSEPAQPPGDRPPPPGWSDHDIEQIIGNLLRAGVLASALVIAIGGALYLYRHGNDPVEDRTEFVPVGPGFSRPTEIVKAVFHLSGRGLISFGLLLLIATPVARVVFSAYAFARQGDRTYLAITLFVLVVLLYSLFSGQIH